MVNSTPRRPSSLSNALLLCAAALFLGPLGASAQVFSKTQDFSQAAATPTTYVGAPGTPTNAATAGYYNPDFTTAGGSGAFGAADNNASVTPNTIPFIFATQTFQTGSTNNKLTFQLGQKGQFGFDDNNSVLVNISLNYGTAVTVLTVTGPNSNSAPVFNIGTGGSAPAVSYAIPEKITMGEATNQNPSLNAIGNFTITLPNFTKRTTVDVTIVVKAARKSNVLIDNVTISSGSPLPVELTRFDATAKAAGVNLTWATATEKNSDRFEIQRSATGSEYTTIGTVKGQGSTTMAHEYSFMDSRPLAGASYYRLRQVDSDGTFSFSPVAAVQTEASTKVMFYPNPSANQLILPAGVGTVQYRIFNALGQTLLSGKATDNDRLDITSLPKGPFFLELSGTAGHHTQRLLRE
jgi:hypothetical protein